MFQKVNRLFTFIPMLLVWEYLFLFLIRNTDWYAEKVKIIDDIDSIIVIISMLHFLCLIELYSKLQIKYCLSIFLIIQLQFLYYFIPENIYYLIYLLLIFYPIIATFI